MVLNNKGFYLLVVLILLASSGTVTSQIKVDLKKIIKHTNIETSYPYWSPDGSKIVFQSNRNDNDSEIYIMDMDGTNTKRLTHSPGLDETPIWSPNGKSILFASERDGNYEVYLMDVDGTNVKNLTNHPAHDGHPNFSPDGQKIIFHSNRSMPDSTFIKNEFTTDINHELYEMNIDGSDFKRITDYPLWDTYPDISPDGSKIAFRRLVETQMGIYKTNSEVFVANRDGSNAYNLTNYPDHDGWPAWSPDGSKIAFASERERFNNWQIYTINPDGTDITRITEFDSQGGYFAKPQWSPDGSKIICTRTKDGNVEIFIIDLEKP
ncbi:Protein TolB [Flagellimonas maritima]|uniref:Protein TolB n=1 Tax=Flagellimonas maritima TaxID=1383885 RepID=A0A2Z4LVM2_9FLAO|nr:PD40 domain-containing protein [Allomuricauda aurantiaca]AWX45750.1 Protein TolB [Allomuricauda aurantiaca]